MREHQRAGGEDEGRHQRMRHNSEDRLSCVNCGPDSGGFSGAAAGTAAMGLTAWGGGKESSSLRGATFPVSSVQARFIAPREIEYRRETRFDRCLHRGFHLVGKCAADGFGHVEAGPGHLDAYRTHLFLHLAGKELSLLLGFLQALRYSL
jgi:hypothetical protein